MSAQVSMAAWQLIDSLSTGQRRQVERKTGYSAHIMVEVSRLEALLDALRSERQENMRILERARR